MEFVEPPQASPSTRSPPVSSSPFASFVSSSSALIETQFRPLEETSALHLPSPSSTYLMEFGAFSAPKPSSFPPVEPKIEYAAGPPSFASSSSTTTTTKSSDLLVPDIGAPSPGAAASGEGLGIPSPLEFLQSTPIPPFLSKTYELVDDRQLDPVISWGTTGESFVVWDPLEFSRAVLPRHFKHNNFSSFVRQLHTYIDADRWEFANEDFLRGKRSLLKNISRRRSSQAQQIVTQTGSSVEIGKSGLDSELQKLRKEKSLLMQEVVRLKQEHLMTVQQVDTLNQRVLSAELRQKQMVSFLAKVLQNPVFLARLKQQKEQRDIASKVRRKFLRQKQHPSQSNLDKSTGQQIVKYRPDLSGATSFSALQGVEGGTSQQLPDHLLQDMVGKLGIDSSGQEFLVLVGSDEPGARMLDPVFLDSNIASLKGKDIVNFQTDVSFSVSEYFISSPEDIIPDKMLSDALVPASESVSMTDSKTITFKGKSAMNFETDATLSGSEYPMSFLDQEDTSQEQILLDPIGPASREEELWNVGFEVGGSSFTSSHDIWDELVHFDAQGLEVAAGPCALWDLGLHTPEEVLEIDKYVGGESSSQEHKNEDGVQNEDHSKD